MKCFDKYLNVNRFDQKKRSKSNSDVSFDYQKILLVHK